MVYKTAKASGGGALKGESCGVARKPGDVEVSGDAGWLLLVGSDIMLPSPRGSSLRSVWRLLCGVKPWHSSTEQKLGIDLKHTYTHAHWGAGFLCQWGVEYAYCQKFCWKSNSKGRTKQDFPLLFMEAFMGITLLLSYIQRLLSARFILVHFFFIVTRWMRWKWVWSD